MPKKSYDKSLLRATLKADAESRIGTASSGGILSFYSGLAKTKVLKSRKVAGFNFLHLSGSILFERSKL